MRYANCDLAALTLAFAVSSSVLSAQATVRPDNALRLASARTAAVAAPRVLRADDRGEIVRTAPFRAVAEAGSIVIVRVPLPAEIAREALRVRQPIAFRVVTQPTVRVLGRTIGTLAARDSAVSVTLGVSRAASAGKNSAAVVEFSVGANVALGVPLELDVPVQRNLQLLVPDAFIGGVRGNWTTVRVELLNRGNDVERVSLKVQAPQGWRSSAPEFPNIVSLAAGASSLGTVRLWIPDKDNLGQRTVRLTLTSSGVTVAMSEVRVDVRDANGASLAGPHLTLSAVGSSLNGTETSFGYGASLDGAIADSVSISGRFSISDGARGSSAYGVARLGMANAPPSLAITSPHVNVSAGAVGEMSSELNGYSVNGLGGSSRVRAGGYAVSGFVARPYGFGQSNVFATGDGLLTGVSLQRITHSSVTSVRGSHMSDAVGSRSLDALSVESKLASVGGGEFTNELGYRRFAQGAGTGFATAYRRSVAGSSIDLHYVHAPGGSRAFARAADDASLSVSQQLGKGLSLAGGGWLGRDNNPTLGNLANAGWFVSPTLNVRRISTSFSVEAHGSQFSSITSVGRFASEEKQVGAGLESRFGGSFVSAHSSLGEISRTLNLSGQDTPTATGTRLDSRVALGTMIGSGTIDASWFSQQATGPAGLLPQQQSVSARVTQLHVPFFAAIPITANGEVQRFFTGSQLVSNWTARGGVTITLPMGMAVSLQAERNPFLFAAQRGRQLLYTVRVDRVTQLPRFAASRNQSVFNDANANGRRDAGEPGVAGVLIECGGSSIVSDQDGRFACASGSEMTVDPRSVPTGFLAPSARLRATAHGDIALRPVTAQIVRLTLVEADTFRVKQGDLSRAIVIARDASGAPWTARSTGDGAFVFDALLPGRYQLELDPGDIAEPLRPVDALPELLVRGGSTVQAINISLRPRGLKIKQIDEHAAPAPTQAPAAKPSRAKQSLGSESRSKQSTAPVAGASLGGLPTRSQERL